MKDITVILVHYADLTAFQKALYSLKQIYDRLNSIIVFQYKGQSVKNDSGGDWFNQLSFINSEQKLNEVIHSLVTPYVLFLHGTDFLSTTIDVDSLKIPHTKKILATCFHSRNIVTHHPLLVSISFLKKEKLFSNSHLPFREALLPAWLSNVEESLQLIKDDGLVKKSRKSISPNTFEKEKFIQKYQLPKVETGHPSIGVLISNYNMGKYIETAIVSCLLQNEQFEQILIIDDGSTDNSYQQMQRWHDGQHVKVFNKENEGKAKALNQLLPHVTTDFVLELDADDWLDPDAVSVIKMHLSSISDAVAVLYGNLRKWKQLSDDVLFKGISKGIEVFGTNDLLSYRFPLGPRIYRTSILKQEGGFPVIEFEDGRLYEDVSMLIQLSKKYRFLYHNFTVYNVREHHDSITKKHGSKWNRFIELQNLT